MDNPNAFKNWINKAVVRKLATAISEIYPAFPEKKFLAAASELDPLELKARVLVITRYLRLTLPAEYPEAIRILVQVMKESELRSFELWPFSEYISQFGLDHFDLSLNAMVVLTQKFTAEFAVRPFLLKDHKRVLRFLAKCVFHESPHVRRWVSEGTRPLLPWGQKLPLFIMDPSHTLLLLEKLKFDDELYVRKSVANHLNDISKNHPQVVVEILRLWERDAGTLVTAKVSWVKRHALRTLIKKGYAPALKLMGAADNVQVEIRNLKLKKKNLKLNETLEFSFLVKSLSQKPQKLIIDYAIDFVKANGDQGKKVFKLKTTELPPEEMLEINKIHKLKPITTMKFYSGVHHLSLQVNGKKVCEVTFRLTV